MREQIIQALDANAQILNSNIQRQNESIQKPRAYIRYSNVKTPGANI